MAGSDPALLLVSFLPLRFPQKLRGFSNPRVFAGIVGGPHVRRAVSSALPGNRGAVRRISWADSTDAARDCEGDGAFGEQAQRSPGKFAGILDLGRRSAPIAVCL